MRPFHIVIPARYASRRLPGKVLLDIGGKPMIRHVVECAARSAASSVVVATDDARVEQAVRDFGARVVMTSSAHPSGTDRVAEAVGKLGFADQEIVVNVQGDEPEMPPELIDQVAELLASRPQAAVATASAPLDHPAQLADPSVVKVVVDRNGYALYFSRAAIPHSRDAAAAASAAAAARRHLGIYAYRCGYLRRFAERPVCPVEEQEKLEQLRALWYGEKIACAEATAIPAAGIDTRADLERARRAAGSGARPN